MSDFLYVMYHILVGKPSPAWLSEAMNHIEGQVADHHNTMKIISQASGHPTTMARNQPLKVEGWKKGEGHRQQHHVLTRRRRSILNQCCEIGCSKSELSFHLC